MRGKKTGSGGANWMDTYGDMVTLLLCFFVLLYSMSTLDQKKWEVVVQSFNPDSISTPTATPDGGGPSADVLGQDQAAVDEAIQKLYDKLSEYAAEESNVGAGAQDNISVTKGDGYVFLSFNDAVFFDGDRYELRPEGAAVLDKVAEILSQAGDAIDEVKVLGHTAQGTAEKPNNPTVDRFLSSNRATVVTVYLQEHSTIEPGRFLSVGYGQWRPVSGNETAT
ncbi:MAG: flagellar motor protein MotB, partial [Oscillospiraceae bacterium]